MSLYELMSTFQALVKRQKGIAQTLSPEEIGAQRTRLSEMFKNDPKVRLH